VRKSAFCPPIKIFARAPISPRRNELEAIYAADFFSVSRSSAMGIVDIGCGLEIAGGTVHNISGKSLMSGLNQGKVITIVIR